MVKRLKYKLDDKLPTACFLKVGEDGLYWEDEMFEQKEDNKMENQNITVNMENLSNEERTTLLSLIEKASKPKNKVWKPEENETYYYICSYCNIEKDTYYDINIKNNIHKNRYAIGNCFKTKEEAEFALERQKVITELKRFTLEHNEGEIDWSNGNQYKYYLYFNHYENRICISACTYYTYTQCIYFTSSEIAQAAIKEISEERIKKYYFEVKE